MVCLFVFKQGKTWACLSTDLKRAVEGERAERAGHGCCEAPEEAGGRDDWRVEEGKAVVSVDLGTWWRRISCLCSSLPQPCPSTTWIPETCVLPQACCSLLSACHAQAPDQRRSCQGLLPTLCHFSTLSSCAPGMAADILLFLNTLPLLWSCPNS